MNITIEHIFCPYCDEVINLYFIIMNTILFFRVMKLNFAQVWNV